MSTGDEWKEGTPYKDTEDVAARHFSESLRHMKEALEHMAEALGWEGVPIMQPEKER